MDKQIIKEENKMNCVNYRKGYGKHYGQYCHSPRESEGGINTMYKETNMEEQAEYKSPQKLDDRPARHIPKYEPTDKPITLWAVLREAPECSMTTVPEFIRSFAHWQNRVITYSPDPILQPLHFPDSLCTWLNDRPKALAWFVEHGFLREVERETYSVGDRFDLGGREYILAGVGGPSANMINLTDGIPIKHSMSLVHWPTVSRDEFKRLVEPFYNVDDFTKIPSPRAPSQ